MLPIRSAKIVKKTDRVARARDDSQCGDVFRRGIVIRGHAIERRLLFPLLVEIHFKLKGKQVRGGSIGVELIVDRKEHARGIHRVSGSAKMPRRVPEKIALLDDGGFDSRRVDRVLREQDAVLEIFTGMKRHGSSRRFRGRRRSLGARLCVFLGLLRRTRGCARQKRRQQHHSGAGP